MATARNKSRTFFTDIWLYRTIIGVLGLAVLVCIAGTLMLAMNGKPTPKFLVALGSAAIGGLAGFLTPSSLGKRG